MAQRTTQEDRIAVIVVAMLVIVAVFALVLLFTRGSDVSGKYIYWDEFRRAEGASEGGRLGEKASARASVASKLAEMQAAGESSERHLSQRHR